MQFESNLNASFPHGFRFVFVSISFSFSFRFGFVSFSLFVCFVEFAFVNNQDRGSSRGPCLHSHMRRLDLGMQMSFLH